MKLSEQISKHQIKAEVKAEAPRRKKRGPRWLVDEDELESATAEESDSTELKIEIDSVSSESILENNSPLLEDSTELKTEIDSVPNVDSSELNANNGESIDEASSELNREFETSDLPIDLCDLDNNTELKTESTESISDQSSELILEIDSALEAGSSESNLKSTESISNRSTESKTKNDSVSSELKGNSTELRPEINSVLPSSESKTESSEPNSSLRSELKRKSSESNDSVLKAKKKRDKFEIIFRVKGNEEKVLRFLSSRCVSASTPVTDALNLPAIVDGTGLKATGVRSGIRQALGNKLIEYHSVKPGPGRETRYKLDRDAYEFFASTESNSDDSSELKKGSYARGIRRYEVTEFNERPDEAVRVGAIGEGTSLSNEEQASARQLSSNSRVRVPAPSWAHKVIIPENVAEAKIGLGQIQYLERLGHSFENVQFSIDQLSGGLYLGLDKGDGKKSKPWGNIAAYFMGAMIRGSKTFNLGIGAEGTPEDDKPEDDDLAAIDHIPF